MTTKKFILSVLAGFIGFSVTAFLLEQLIFKNYMEKAFYQPTGIPVVPATNLPILTFAIPLSIALIMAYIYPKGYEGGSPVVEGLRFGVLLGLFSGIPYGVYFAITYAIGFGPVLAQILFYALEVAAAGLLIGLVYGRMHE